MKGGGGGWTRGDAAAGVRAVTLDFLKRKRESISSCEKEKRHKINLNRQNIRTHEIMMAPYKNQITIKYYFKTHN